MYLCSLAHRYEILTPNAIPKGFMDGKQACERMVPASFSGCCACGHYCFTVHFIEEIQIMSSGFVLKSGPAFTNSTYSSWHQ